MLLLSYFRRNSRRNLTQISKETGIPVSTIFDRLRKFESDVICKHTSLLNFRALGYDIVVKMLVTVDKASREKFQAFISRSMNINSAYRTNEGFIIETIFRNIKDMYEFNERLSELIIRKEEYFVIEQLKREDFLSDPMFL